jgi:hypothetical protein
MKSKELKQKVERAEKIEGELEKINKLIEDLINLSTPGTASHQCPILFVNQEFTISNNELRQIYENRKASLEHELKSL